MKGDRQGPLDRLWTRLRGNKTWAVRLSDTTPAGQVVLRPLKETDETAWLRLRSENHRWLGPWEATVPATDTPTQPTTFSHYVRALHRAAQQGTALPFVIELDGKLVGQITVTGITYGSLRSAVIGYWISRHVAGRGIVPTAVALATDHCFTTLGLHRMEINIRPGNERSLRVVAKLGFRDEGIRQRYLHIEGDWRDHRTFALTSSEVPDGLLARWKKRQ